MAVSDVSFHSFWCVSVSSSGSSPFESSSSSSPQRVFHGHANPRIFQVSATIFRCAVCYWVRLLRKIRVILGFRDLIVLNRVARIGRHLGRLS